MVTDLILGWVMSAIAWFINLLPHPDLPEWAYAGVPSWVEGGVDWAVAMDHWIPTQAIGYGVAFLLLASAAAFAIRVGRIVLSFLTLGGGSAA